MKQRTVLLDPTDERDTGMRMRRDPLDSLAGRTVALLDIGKSKGDVFIDRLETRFDELGVSVRRYSKPTNTRVAPDQLSQQIAAEADVVVEALSD